MLNSQMMISIHSSTHNFFFSFYSPGNINRISCIISHCILNRQLAELWSKAEKYYGNYVITSIPSHYIYIISILDQWFSSSKVHWIILCCWLLIMHSKETIRPSPFCVILFFLQFIASHYIHTTVSFLFYNLRDCCCYCWLFFLFISFGTQRVCKTKKKRMKKKISSNSSGWSKSYKAGLF